MVLHACNHPCWQVEQAANNPGTSERKAQGVVLLSDTHTHTHTVGVGGGEGRGFLLLFSDKYTSDSHLLCNPWRPHSRGSPGLQLLWWTLRAHTVLVGDGPGGIHCWAGNNGLHLNLLGSRWPMTGLCVPTGALFCRFAPQACLGKSLCSGFSGRSVSRREQPRVGKCSP